MLPKKNRYTRTEFDDFSSNSNTQTTYNKLGTLKYVLKGHKLAVVTSSKHEKRAVMRNRTRRRLYSRFATVTSPLSGILYVSKQSYGFDGAETKSLFDSLLLHAEKNTKSGK
jgi:ribonuclease P protein component